jgi:hypothetical protein
MKPILKKIFPAAFLKKAFLVYNRTKLRTIDKIFYSEYKLPPEKFLLYRKLFPFVVNNVSTERLTDPVVKKFMDDWYGWTDEEYILKITGKCVIEPEHGWGIIDKKLLYYSLGLSRTDHMKKPRRKYLAKNIKARHFKQLISLRDTGEENYFHFYNDVLAKLFFLSQHGIDIKGMAVLVAKKAFEKPFFKFFVQHHPYFKNINWVIQDDEPVSADETWFCKPVTHDKEILLKLAEPFLTHTDSERRIFLTRSKSRLRFIENQDEMEEVCREFDIEMIDTDFLSMQEQIDLFNNASFIVAIHGAGLTNLIYRANKNCKLLELFPPAYPDYLPLHYFLMAEQLGFEFDAFIGGKGQKFSGGFYVSKEQLRSAIVQMMNENSAAPLIK